MVVKTETLLKRRANINEELKTRSDLDLDLFSSLHREGCSLCFEKTGKWKVGGIKPGMDATDSYALIVPELIARCSVHNVKSKPYGGEEYETALTDEILVRFGNQR